MRGSRGHGPYWYEYWRDGARTRKRYWGRRRPTAQDFAGDEERERAEHGPSRRTSYDRARDRHDSDLEVLALPSTFDSKALRRAYRKAAFANHPDRGGSDKRMKEINAAYERLRKTRAPAAR